MAKLSVEQVTKRFIPTRGHDVVALDKVSLEVDDELFVIVGPSGCGKTTLLRLIAGLETPDAGRISLNGTVLNSIPAKDRNIAMVFQSPALLPHLTIYENIAFGLMLRKVAKADIERRVNEAADTLGLKTTLRRKPSELSGGEAQRVALARSLVREPKLFLLDEPLSSLDRPTRKQLRCEIVCMRQRLGVPMIYVTHDQREALSLGGRIAVLNRGQLQQIGTAEELTKQPANRFVEEFFDPTA